MDEIDYGGSSPVAQKEGKVETMNFYDALREIANGNKISKIEWGKENMVHCYLSGNLKIFIGEREQDWIISQADMEGTDYYIWIGTSES